jgi:putative endonuclease
LPAAGKGTDLSLTTSLEMTSLKIHLSLKHNPKPNSYYLTPYFYQMKEHRYFVYILHCGDGTFYTGVTNNLKRREAEHLDGYNEHSYTHNRQPTVLVYNEEFKYIDKAITREKQIKKWSQAKKKALIGNYADRITVFAKKKFE